MDEHRDTGDNDAFKGLLILMRLIWGPLSWSILAPAADPAPALRPASGH